MTAAVNFEGKMSIKIIYKDKNFAVIYKPAGIPSQSDNSADKDAMTLTSEALSAHGERSELWLVHRLDRVVGGLMVFARNKKYAAILSALAAERGMKKEYLAVVDGVTEGGVFTDYLYKDAAKGKAFVVDRARAGVKLAELECSPLSSVETEKGRKTLVKVELHTGRFHQIRAQLSARKTPITLDGKYGSRDGVPGAPALFAFRLSFVAEGKDYSFFHLPEAVYPWTLFELQKYLTERDR